jgi:hypothetical protein
LEFPLSKTTSVALFPVRQRETTRKRGIIDPRRTGPSLREHGHDDWDPDWITERFSGLLYCSNTDCGDIAAISGTSGASYYTDEDIDGKMYQTVENSLDPKSIFPPPHLFSITPKCPEAVRAHLLSGFELIWSDYESCANKFRMAVEALLTERKVATYSRLVKGKPRRPLGLPPASICIVLSTPRPQSAWKQ